MSARVSRPDNAALIVVASKSHRDKATDDYIARYRVADFKSAGSSLKFCLLACGATTGIAAALWKAEVEQGSTVAVFGAGMVGLGAVAGAKLRGAERIVVVDPSAERRALAERFGATLRGHGARLELRVREKEVDEVLRAVLDAGGRVVSVTPHRVSLESVFLSAVSGEVSQ